MLSARFASHSNMGVDLDQFLADREAKPDTAVLDTALAALGGKKAKRRKGAKDGEPKALLAKQEAQARAGVKVTDGELKAMKAAKGRRDAASGGRGQ